MKTRGGQDLRPADLVAGADEPAPAPRRRITLMGGHRSEAVAKEPRRVKPRRRARPELRTRAARLLLWLLVFSGAAGGITAAVRPTPAPVVSDVEVPASALGPSGVAEGFISAFLQAGQDREDLLAGYLADPPSLTRVEPGSMLATRVATLTATETEPGAWSIAVAADVMLFDAEVGGYTAAGTRCYLTAVRAVAEGWAVMGLPAQISCPPPAPTPGLDYSSSSVPLTDSDLVGDTVSRFMAALLAGTGELSRYLQPDADITAIIPAPFTEVDLTALLLSGNSPDIDPDTAPADGLSIEVLASVEGTDAGGRVQRLAYVLELSSRGGRWEVVTLTANPSIN